jgi:hypothetical protein
MKTHQEISHQQEGPGLRECMHVYDFLFSLVRVATCLW